MRNALLAVAALAGVLMLNSGSAEARDYRFCLKQGWEPGPGQCDFNTYAQCMASASGRAAYCDVNPRLAYGKQVREQRRTRGQYAY